MSTLKIFSADTFGADAFWVKEEDVSGKVLYKAATRYRWEDIECVQDWPTPSPYDEKVTPQGPKCILLYGNNEVKLLVSFDEMCAAWEKWRLGAAARKLLTPFPTTGNN